MPETNCVASKALTERLRKIIAETSVIDSIFDLTITISLGVACWDGQTEMSVDKILARADKALYYSKENGRDRVTMWGEIESE